MDVFRKFIYYFYVLFIFIGFPFFIIFSFFYAVIVFTRSLVSFFHWFKDDKVCHKHEPIGGDWHVVDGRWDGKCKHCGKDIVATWNLA